MRFSDAGACLSPKSLACTHGDRDKTRICFGVNRTIGYAGYASHGDESGGFVSGLISISVSRSPVASLGHPVKAWATASAAAQSRLFFDANYLVALFMVNSLDWGYICR